MESADYANRTDILFAKWLDRLKRDITAGLDGAVDSQAYFASNPRIVFLLKEMNATFWEQQNLIKFLAEHADRGQTWNNVVRWTRIIRAVLGAKAEAPQYDDHRSINKAHRMAELQSIAAVNAKKTPGSGDSHLRTINLHMERYGDLLADQLELLDPNVIVLYGIAIHHIREFKHLTMPPEYWSLARLRGRERLVIWSDHPAARARDQVSFAFITEACMSAREKHGTAWIG